MIYMNIRDLKYLVALADHQHFGKAAEACFVSQPTLSAQLKKLENELGVQLFERANKRFLITPAGTALISQAKIILKETRHLQEMAKQMQDPLAGMFRLGLIPTIGPYLLPHILPAIKQYLPNLELFLYEEKTTILLEQLNQGLIDAVILALPIEDNQLSMAPLFQEPFWVALPSAHPLTRKKKLRLEDLNNENLLLLAEGHCLRDQALEICHHTGVTINASYQASSLETLRFMVASNAGITLLPALAIKNDPAIAIRPLSPQMPTRNIGMLWRKMSTRNDANTAIVKIIKNAVKI